MEQHAATCIAEVKFTFTEHTVKALELEDKSGVAWDDKFNSFGCRVQPSSTKPSIINYRARE